MNYKFKIKWIILLSLFGFCIFSGIVFALGTWNTGYRAYHGVPAIEMYIGNSEGTADSGACHKVVNNHSSNDYFVPTKTTAEWNAFNANKPTGISISDCSVCIDNDGDGWSSNGWTYYDVAAGSYTDAMDTNSQVHCGPKDCDDNNNEIWFAFAGVNAGNIEKPPFQSSYIISICDVDNDGYVNPASSNNCAIVDRNDLNASVGANSNLASIQDCGLCGLGWPSPTCAMVPDVNRGCCDYDSDGYIEYEAFYYSSYYGSLSFIPYFDNIDEGIDADSFGLNTNGEMWDINPYWDEKMLDTNDKLFPIKNVRLPKRVDLNNDGTITCKSLGATTPQCMSAWFYSSYPTKYIYGCGCNSSLTNTLCGYTNSTSCSIVTIPTYNECIAKTLYIRGCE